MKPTLVEKIYIALLVLIFGGIVLHAPFSVGFGVLFPDYALVFKAWKEILLLILLPLAIAIIVRRKLWPALKKDLLFKLITGYVLLHFIITVIFYEGAVTTLAGLAIDLRYIAFFGLIYIGIKAMPQYRRLLMQVAIIGAYIVVGFATLQLFLPPDILSHIGYSTKTIVPYLTVDKNPDYIRVNSTLRGPNPLGAYAGMVLGLLTAAFVKGKLLIKNKIVCTAASILAICSLVALWISYSRSALVAGIVTVALVFAIATFRRISRRNWMVIGAVVITLVGALALLRNTSFVSNVLLHENPNGGSEISSNEDHVSSLEYGIGQLLREPLGGGVGSTGSASLFGGNPTVVENQYLFIGHEVGVIGLALFLVIFGLLMYRLFRQKNDWLSLGVFSSGVGLSLIGLLLPVWADDTVAIIWWGLAGIALATGGAHGRKTPKQKTARTA